jgi:hypothetical protein
MANTKASTAQPDDDHWQDDHLGWSAKQGRILTDGGNALRYYSHETGHPFLSEELPHYHLERGDTHPIFLTWAKERCDRLDAREERSPILVLPGAVTATILPSSPIVGAWSRTIFAGRWEHTSDKDEVSYNIQTGTLFVDLRIPRTKPIGRWEELEHVGIETLKSLSDYELRLYARQHVFGGFSVLTTESKQPGRPLATRHHCIDWNHIPGKPRPRPNKWYIECENTAGPTNRWKEWSYSTDQNGQCYYYEVWERIKDDVLGQGLCLAMRKRNGTDGIMVVVGVSQLEFVLISSGPRSLCVSFHIHKTFHLLSFRITSTIF